MVLIDTVITPVGGYGPAFAQRLNAITRFGISTIEDQLEDASAAALREYPDVLRRTSRGMDGAPPKQTVQEGWLSIHQAAAHLTGQRVEGRDDPSALLREIAEEGLIRRVTELFPMGLIGPLTLGGRFFKDPLRVGTSGKVELRPEFEAWLKLRHAEHMKIARSHINRGHFGEWGTGRICPIAGKDGAMNPLVNAFSHAEQKLADA